MLTHATLHGGCMDTATESALKIDAERKTLAEPGNGTASVLRLAFRSDPLAADLPRPLQSVCTTVTDLTTMRRCLHSCPCDVFSASNSCNATTFLYIKKKKKKKKKKKIDLCMGPFCSTFDYVFLRKPKHIPRWTFPRAPLDHFTQNTPRRTSSLHT